MVVVVLLSGVVWWFVVLMGMVVVVVNVEWMMLNSGFCVLLCVCIFVFV